MRPLHGRSCACAAFVACAAPALGASENIPVLEAVIVKDTAEGAGPLTQPGAHVARERIERTPGGANIVDAETYRESRTSALNDALRYSPGVFVQPRFGSEEARISIRGSGIQRTFHLRGVKILQDGVPVNLADGSGDFQVIEPLAAQYIEVYRGANALQFGSTTLGGAVNFVSPTGYDASALQLRGELGSFGYRRLHGASGGVSGDVDYFASYSTFDQDGFRRHADQSAQRFFGNAGFRVSPDLETRFYAAYVNTVSQLPGAITKAQLAADPRQANVANVTGDQKRDFDLWRFANKTTLRLGAGRLELSAYYSDKLLFHPIFQVLDQQSHDYGAEIRWVSDARLLGRENRFIAGFAPARGDLRDDRFVNVGGGRGARTNRLEQTATNLDFYVENQHRVEQWTLVAGAQYSRARRRNVDRFIAGTPADPVSESFDLDYSALSPKLGAIYALRPGVQIFGNFSKSFEPPSFGELTGGLRPVLNRAQKATTLEVGSRGAAAGTTFDVAYYYGRVKDELLTTTTNIAGANITVNVPRTVHAGIELGTTTRLGSFELRQAFLYNRFRFDDDPVFRDNTLPGIPKTFLSAEIIYRAGNGFYAGPTLEWSPARYPVDMANSFYADPYALLGVKVGQRIGKAWLWYIEGRNLTDRQYAATTGVARTLAGADGAQFFPGDGRSIYTGVQWQM